MALSKTSGPEGIGEDGSAIDQGTLARLLSPIPGPIGLRVKPKVPSSSQAPARHQLGITIHPASQVSADEWVKKINASDDVPDHFKKQIKAKGDLILVTNPKKFMIPTNVIPRDWVSDWLAAFNVEEWEMTTGSLDMSVKKGDAGGPFIKTVHNPDLSSGETVDGFTQFTMTNNSRSTAGVMVEMGITLPDGVALKSGRKLIVISNRIALTLEGAKTKIFTFNDAELLGTWFHEIACHAGRNSIKKVDTHGDKEVEASARDIDDMFPKSVTPSKVLVEVQAFLKPQPTSQPKPK
jgi:hypothetical protein